MTIASSRLIPGTDAYWHDRKEAFALIRRFENAIAACKRAPLYLPGRDYDEEDNSDDVVENLGPWDRADALRTEARGNLTVVEILTAQKRLALID
ncbi:hypothetical protein ACFW16_23890 [Inquilinus sp. NPDC058860]|uniref:hypothetical protein n=1 Tax=Inquilinus sp. NPDC058860 TaxID=3346652 RepID=UPI0036C6459E